MVVIAIKVSLTGPIAFQSTGSKLPRFHRKSNLTNGPHFNEILITKGQSYRPSYTYWQ